MVTDAVIAIAIPQINVLRNDFFDMAHLVPPYSDYGWLILL